tara:strand:- start:6 stop:563 length:558 start_codon:yes stop_codon:yes gene_type:complete
MSTYTNIDAFLFPCDTVWGICAPITEDNCKKIIALKKRPETMGFVVLIRDFSDLNLLCAPLNEDIVQILKDNWPGPITFILPKHPGLSPLVTGGKDTVAIRFPNHTPLLEHMKQLNGPLLSTSANLHGQETPKKWDEISTEIRDNVEHSYFTDTEPKNRASTIVDLTKTPFSLIRKGDSPFKTPF